MASYLRRKSLTGAGPSDMPGLISKWEEAGRNTTGAATKKRKSALKRMGRKKRTVTFMLPTQEDTNDALSIRKDMDDEDIAVHRGNPLSPYLDGMASLQDMTSSDAMTSSMTPGRLELEQHRNTTADEWLDIYREKRSQTNREEKHLLKLKVIELIERNTALNDLLSRNYCE